MKTIIYSDDEHQFINEDWIFGKYTPMHTKLLNLTISPMQKHIRMNFWLVNLLLFFALSLKINSFCF